ncbi:phosphatase and actin regulator 3, transcript variant X3 [Ictidomys tridecemlineatus]|uniref:phosphatase and actin regulator 3 isoform X2 n=1 Tax=Ictidomys tridecemlineatus TaxID=43179 RepID=UPI000B543489|nr:phosphatase and actin regulator 3 isoform X2 [Ictidomys tridecemlineatus]KAG3263590.1 phosphatase and actin regulator 3, transcript variant X3 [Ictidomys tridecemlineatus]
MAASEDGSGCLVSRGRSQSDPTVLTDSSATSSADAGENPDEMDQAPPVRSEYLVSGIRTPPVRRNSKLATLGRIFKPWKWRKKKTEKLKQTTSALEKKMASKQGREELIKQGLLEMMEQDAESKMCSPDGGPRSTQSEPSTPKQETLTANDVQPGSPVATGEGQASLEEPLSSDTHLDDAGQAVLFQGPGVKSADPPLRGQLSTPTGSPHLTTVHRPLPPSRVMEELHRALATKHRQDSFQGREGKGSPKKRVDVRLSRTSSMERGKEREEAWSADGVLENKRTAAKESEENKENLLLNSELQDDLLLYQDEEVLNDSVISGTLPRKCKKELLAVKLRNRPSKQELEDRNIFPRRTDEERQEIRQQIEMKLSKRLSQRPAVEELERRNILKQRNDQTEQEERREIKQRLTRKLNQRPTVDELRDRKILIRFSDYVEVAKAQDYDRRADKPWTRLSAADKAAIRKELNEYKSNEMEVHASSKHLTRFHRP